MAVVRRRFITSALPNYQLQVCVTFATQCIPVNSAALYEIRVGSERSLQYIGGYQSACDFRRSHCLAVERLRPNRRQRLAVAVVVVAANRHRQLINLPFRLQPPTNRNNRLVTDAVHSVLPKRVCGVSYSRPIIRCEFPFFTCSEFKMR